MGESKIPIYEVDGEEATIIGAANYLVKQLESDLILTKDMKQILANLLWKLSRVVAIDDRDKENGVGEIEERLNVLTEKIMSREADESMIWESGPDSGNDYIATVNELITLIERLDGSEDVLQRKAHDALEMAMTRLEDEFRHILVENQLLSEPEHMLFRSNEAEGAEEGSVVSTEDSVIGGQQNGGETVIDLINPEVIPDLKKIANAMVSARYGYECIQMYTIVRKEVLDEFLCKHEIEKMSIEDVLKMDWSKLNLNIIKWVHVMRKLIPTYLASEKSLDNQIFADQIETGLSCFVNTVKTPIMQLLNFGEAVSLGPRQPEKLLRILEMYELVSELLPDIEALFPDEAGSSIRLEYCQVMRRLGDCARSTFLDFKNAIATDIASTPLPGGGVHLLTNYVMNYLIALTDFSHTLDSLLREYDDAANMTPPRSPDINVVTEEENIGEKSHESGKLPTMTRHFYHTTSVLETNLKEKSRLYKDVSMQHIFLMNNLHYMTRKVMNSDLAEIFGSKWSRSYTWKFQQHAKEYQRATWCTILAMVKEEGSSSGSKELKPRQRFQNFNAAFEEVYKTQTAWLIPEKRLRDDLRTSVAQWVVGAYYIFYSRHKNDVSEKYIKYSTDDLEKLLLDLFAGSPKSLSNSYRR